MTYLLHEERLCEMLAAPTCPDCKHLMTPGWDNCTRRRICTCVRPTDAVGVCNYDQFETWSKAHRDWDDSPSTVTREELTEKRRAQSLGTASRYKKEAR